MADDVDRGGRSFATLDRRDFAAGVAGALMLRPAAAAGRTRAFRMGFTPHPFDFTEDAFARTYRFIGDNGDIVAHHLDEGVPWRAAQAGSPFAPNVMADIDRRKALTGIDKKVFLSITPLAISRVDLAGEWGEDSHMPRTGEWAARRLDDPEVAKVFVSYARRMIAHFNPSHVAYAIEISELAKTPERGRAFVAFARAVYPALKRDHPDIAFFPTFVLGDSADLAGSHAAFVRELLPFTDVLAVSTYPYVWDGIGGDASRIPADWFRKFAALAPAKPFGVAETGFIAQTYRYLSRLVHIPSTPAQQKAYVAFLLSEAEALKAAFVIWYVPIDYDRLWEKMKAQGMNDWFRQWMSSGLLDAAMAPRPALFTWSDWRSRDIEPGR